MRLLKDFNAVPNSKQLSEWLGRYSPGSHKRPFQTFHAFGQWLEKKGVMVNPWSDIDVPKVPVHILAVPSTEDIMALFKYLDKNYPSELALRNKAIIACYFC